MTIMQLVLVQEMQVKSGLPAFMSCGDKYWISEGLRINVIKKLAPSMQSAALNRTKA